MIKENVIRKSVCAALISCVQIMGLSGCVQMHLIHAANAKPDPDVVRSIRARPRKGEYVITGKHMHREHIPISDIWGYRLDDGSTYRLNKGIAYQVVQTKPLLIYELEEWVGDTRWLTYRFGFTPNGDMYDLDKKTCLAVFRLDECVVGYLNQMPKRLIAEPDGHGSYGLANVYAYCHGSSNNCKPAITETAQDRQ